MLAATGEASDAESVDDEPPVGALPDGALPDAELPDAGLPDPAAPVAAPDGCAALGGVPAIDFLSTPPLLENAVGTGGVTSLTAPIDPAVAAACESGALLAVTRFDTTGEVIQLVGEPSVADPLISDANPLPASRLARGLETSLAIFSARGTPDSSPPVVCAPAAFSFRSLTTPSSEDRAGIPDNSRGLPPIAAAGSAGMFAGACFIATKLAGTRFTPRESTCAEFDFAAAAGTAPGAVAVFVSNFVVIIVSKFITIVDATSEAKPEATSGAKFDARDDGISAAWPGGNDDEGPTGGAAVAVDSSAGLADTGAGGDSSSRGKPASLTNPEAAPCNTLSPDGTAAFSDARLSGGALKVKWETGASGKASAAESASLTSASPTEVCGGVDFFPPAVGTASEIVDERAASRPPEESL
jgi:hypothetical protein